MIAYPANKTQFRADIPKQRGQLTRRSLRRRLGLAHSYKVNTSAPSALLGDLPARHSPQDGGRCAFAVQNSFRSLNRSLPTSTFEIHPSNFASLPGQLFYSTQIPVCVWLSGKNESVGKCRAVSKLELALAA